MTKTEIIAESGSNEITMSREFNASPAQLFRAHTDPELLVKWLGPRKYTMTVDEYDLRHGGKWRYLQIDGDGPGYGFHGVFHGTPSVEDGITQTFEFEGYPGHVCLETLTFDEIAPGRTAIRAKSVYQSVEDRDGMVQSGMETGVNEGYEQLDELLASNAVTT